MSKNNKLHYMPVYDKYAEENEYLKKHRFYITNDIGFDLKDDIKDVNRIIYCLKILNKSCISYFLFCSPYFV